MILKGFTGSFPTGGLTMDSSGNLYGTTVGGGNYNTLCSDYGGCGTAYKLAPDGTYTVLYSFCTVAQCADGDRPMFGVTFDGTGNLYGTTTYSGKPRYYSVRAYAGRH